jgi:hypothetical protein
MRQVEREGLSGEKAVAPIGNDPQTRSVWSSRAEARVRTLARRITSFHDGALGVSYLKHFVLEIEPAELAEVLAIALGRAGAREPPHPELVLSLSVALSERPAVRGLVGMEAARRGLTDVLDFLGPSADALEQVPPASEIKAADGRPLTLGERKSLARRRERSLIARALRDPHPHVIEILLGNPSVTEDDIVRLCARRPIAAEVLRTVFRSPRWIVRYQVLATIAMNPYAPSDIALPLALQLTAQDAKRVASSPELAPELRRVCTRDRAIH